MKFIQLTEHKGHEPETLVPDLFVFYKKTLNKVNASSQLLNFNNFGSLWPAHTTKTNFRMLIQ